MDKLSQAMVDGYGIPKSFIGKIHDWIIIALAYHVMIQIEMKKIQICEYFPEEVVVQILSKLPVKSVLKFTCVCKLWNSIIKSSDFISTFASNKHDAYIFMLHFNSPNYQYSMRFDNRDFDEYLSLQPLFNTANVYDVHVVGSNNGLVCLCYAYRNYGSTTHKLIIWNPSIRKYLLIPEPNFLFLCSISEKLMGFGFDSRTNDYKLLLAQFWGDCIKNVVLYSLNSYSWKNYSNVALNYTHTCMTTPAFVDGRFHCLVITKKKECGAGV
ncbi:F-box protein At3g07870-like [Mercurialis annua]|uniref:F-box protein At3g07870-like n=1 Tax=Mercurialis annua TaxID=3986 RepID=UPI00215E03D3|nr:F-box protein At3g07870-like [Mercurialis annua]